MQNKTWKLHKTTTNEVFSNPDQKNLKEFMVATLISFVFIPQPVTGSACC